MDKIENINVLHKFARFCNEEPDRGYVAVEAEYRQGLDDNPIIAKKHVMCKFGINKYGDSDISIDWDEESSILKRLKVYSNFSSAFQYFEIKDTSLIIQDDEIGLGYTVILNPVTVK